MSVDASCSSASSTLNPRRPRRYILITGATDGIGEQTAVELAANADNFVIIHGRTTRVCIEAIDRIRRLCAVDRGNVDSIVADFAQLRQVVTMVDELRRRFPMLNCVVCNASVLSNKRLETVDGLELTFQVNHLAHFVLVNRLLPMLKNNQPSRIIVVSSVLHSLHSIDWDDVMAERKYDKYRQYSMTKLMNHLFTFALHRNLIANGCDYNVTANVVELGNISAKTTKIVDGINSEQSSTFAAASIGGSVAIANRTAPLIYLIESADMCKVTGKYFNASMKQIRPSADSTDQRLQDRLWTFSESICDRILAPTKLPVQQQQW